MVKWTKHKWCYDQTNHNHFPRQRQRAKVCDYFLFFVLVGVAAFYLWTASSWILCVTIFLNLRFDSNKTLIPDVPQQHYLSHSLLGFCLQIFTEGPIPYFYIFFSEFRTALQLILSVVILMRLLGITGRWFKNLYLIDHTLFAWFFLLTISMNISDKKGICCLYKLYK